MIENRLKTLILYGNFLEAKILLDSINFETLRDILFTIGYDNQSICSYGFICFLLMENETVQYHFLASELLNFAFPHLVGGYATSLYHIRRTIELEPHNFELQANLLFFNEIPDKLINDEEAEKIARIVLLNQPNNPIALNFISSFKTPTNK